MRPLAWAQIAAFALISAALASPALGQTATTPEPSATEAAPPEAPPVVEHSLGPPAPPTPSLLTGLVWLEQPRARDYARLYPRSAQDGNIQARVTLDCTVLEDGRMDCVVTNEDPPGQGFGAATLELSRLFRVGPTTTAGEPTAGGRLRRTIRWLVAG